MATSRADAPAAERGRSLMDWMQVNSRLLGIGAAVVAVALAGLWFYNRSRQIRTVNAERSLTLAQQSLASGNTSLAMSDLQKVAARYEGTAAGTEAAMLLARQNFDQGKFQQGIDALKKAADKSGPSRANVEGLIGDGYAQLGKGVDAARAYERAAAAAGAYVSEQAYYRAKAARSYAAAGNIEEAKKVWGDLAKQEKAPSVAAEAKVRLAELSARRAGS
jgi:predicted negative regulator of RcsB-dependent stress response